jgi:hypothetical protein
LLPNFYSFKFQGSLFHSSKINVNMKFIDFESYQVCALISFEHYAWQFISNIKDYVLDFGMNKFVGMKYIKSWVN